MGNTADDEVFEIAVQDLFDNAKYFEPFFNNLIHMQEAAEAQRTTMDRIDDA